MTTNLFALNSRIKIVAAALSAAADDFEAVRGGRGWAPEAAQLTQRFSIDGAALTEIMDATRSKMAMRAV